MRDRLPDGAQQHTAAWAFLALYNCSPGVHVVSYAPPAWQLGYPVSFRVRRVRAVPEQLLTAQHVLDALQRGHSASRAAIQQDEESAA